MAPVSPPFDAMVNTLAQFKHRRGIRYDLGCFLDACACLGNPQYHLPPTIHVAGTNGKGSTVAYLAEGCRAMGLRVGTYTSPHMISYCERLSDDNGAISESLFCTLATYVINTLGPFWQDKITEFEILTLMAFVYFSGTLGAIGKVYKPDILILETGLGGRLDATNVVMPVVSVITPIGLDHQDILGETVAAIASEKAGIIKVKTPVFSAVQTPDADRVLRDTADKNDAPFTVIPPWQTLPDMYAMQGDYQRQNAALAHAVHAHIASLFQKKQPPPDALAAATVWGRFSVHHRGTRKIVIDGAHNLHGIAGLQASLQRHHIEQPVVWMGILKNRPLGDMLVVWTSLVSELWYTDFAPGTSHDASVLSQIGMSYPYHVLPTDKDWRYYVDRIDALPEGRDLVITGSLYFLSWIYHRVLSPGS